MARGAVIVAAALAVAVAGGIAPGRPGAEDALASMTVLRPSAPTPAPDVAFRTLDGREVRLANMRGRPVLLTFFTTW